MNTTPVWCSHDWDNTKPAHFYQTTSSVTSHAKLKRVHFINHTNHLRRARKHDEKHVHDCSAAKEANSDQDTMHSGGTAQT